jgi:hypothetical protein
MPSLLPPLLLPSSSSPEHYIPRPCHGVERCQHSQLYMAVQITSRNWRMSSAPNQDFLLVLCGLHSTDAPDSLLFPMGHP